MRETSGSLRELLLTLSPTQHEQLGRDIKTLREMFGAHSNTAVILQACRRQAAEAEEGVHPTEEGRAA